MRRLGQAMASNAFDHELHANTFGQDSQYALNKLRHERLKEEMLDLTIYEVLEDYQIAKGSVGEFANSRLEQHDRMYRNDSRNNRASGQDAVQNA